MKKSLLALAALTAFAGVASAQSSVTLFGIVDLSVNSIKNGANSMKTMASDNLNSNRLGFRGVEDLGGGLKAGFWIEGGMSPDNGTATGQTWTRRSTVSLMGGFGEIRLGRDYTASFFNKTVFDPFGTNGLGSELNVESTLGSGATTLVRANNVVGYFLPAMGGLYGQLQVAAGEGATGNKYLGGRLGYAAGPLNIAGAWGKTYKTGAMIDDFKDVNIGASFKMGFMTLEGTYGKVTYGKSDQKKYLIGVLVPVGPGTFKASYNKASGSIKSAAGVLVRDQGAKQFTVGYQYDLSKRTALYATYSSLNNDGNAATGASFVVNAGPTLSAWGETSRGYNLGIRHSF